MEALHAELTERAEAATKSYSAAVSLEDPIKVFSSWIFFQRYFLTILIVVIYKATILKKSFLWLLLSYMAVATYCYYEKLHRMMLTGIVLYLLKTMDAYKITLMPIHW